MVERERERQTERQRQTDRERDRDRQTQRERSFYPLRAPCLHAGFDAMLILQS